MLGSSKRILEIEEENNILREENRILREAIKLSNGKPGDGEPFTCPGVCNFLDKSACWKCKTKFFLRQAEAKDVLLDVKLVQRVIASVETETGMKIKQFIKKNGGITKEELNDILEGD